MKFLILILALVPVSLSAAGLGKIKVKSNLGEPFSAEVDLLEAYTDELASAVARVASADEYADAGLPDTYIPNVHISTIRRSNGTHALRLLSDKPINEPFLELLVKIDSGNTSLMRQYTVLLDPPTSALGEDADSRSDSVDSKPNVADKKRSAETGNAATEYVAPESKSHQNAKHKAHRKAQELNAEAAKSTRTAPGTEAVASDETYITQNGDVFGKVAQRYQPAGISLKHVMAAFYAVNKDAFQDGDVQKLKAGYVLHIPSQESLGGVVPAQTKRQADTAQPTPQFADKGQGIVAAKPAGNSAYVLKISPGEVAEAPGSASIPSTGNLAETSKDGVTEQNPVEQPPADVNKSSERPAPVVVPPAENKPVSPIAQTKKPAVQPVAAEEQSLPSTLLGLGITLLLGLLGVFILNKRRQKAISALHDTGQDSADTFQAQKQETHKTDTAQELSQKAVDDTGASAFDRGINGQSTEIDFHEVDPLIEAEIYMSYGRDKQAEGILSNALVVTPYKHELSLGLLNIYVNRNDLEAFERVARKMYADVQSGSPEDAAVWDKVMQLGKKIDPDNQLYQIDLTRQKMATAAAGHNGDRSKKKVQPENLELLAKNESAAPVVLKGSIYGTEKFNRFENVDTFGEIQPLDKYEKARKSEMDHDHGIEFSLDDILRPVHKADFTESLGMDELSAKSSKLPNSKDDEK